MSKNHVSRQYDSTERIHAHAVAYLVWCPPLTYFPAPSAAIEMTKCEIATARQVPPLECSLHTGDEESTGACVE